MSIRTDWKQAIAIALSLAVLSLAACGGGGGPTTSGLSVRAFVSDDLDGTLHIEDAQHDVESGFTIATGAQPGLMTLSPDGSITLVFDAGAGSLAVVSNATESVLGRIALPSVSTSNLDIAGAAQGRYLSLGNDTVGFVAIPNCPPGLCSGNVGVANFVEVVNLPTVTNASGSVTASIQVTNTARTLVMSPAQNKMLVFSGATDQQDALTVIDIATATGTTPANAATLVGGFDRPVSAVFSTDGSKAYVLNCGPECGSTTATASVTVLDMTTNAPLTTVPVPAATVGLLNGTKLFVAGTPSGAVGKGKLSVLDLTAPASPVTTTTVDISDGFHNHMELASNNKLFIGAVTCSAGCLTIFDTGANTADSPDPNSGDVTGIAPIGARNVVYVVENVAAGSLFCPGQLPCLGELRIYFTTAKPTLTPTQIDVVGKAVDVKFVE